MTTYNPNPNFFARQIEIDQKSITFKVVLFNL